MLAFDRAQIPQKVERREVGSATGDHQKISDHSDVLQRNELLDIHWSNLEKSVPGTASWSANFHHLVCSKQQQKTGHNMCQPIEQDSRDHMGNNSNREKKNVKIFLKHAQQTVKCLYVCLYAKHCNLAHPRNVLPSKYSPPSIAVQSVKLSMLPECTKP